MTEHVDVAALSTLREVMDGEYPRLLEVFIKDSEERIGELNRLMLAPGVRPMSGEALRQLGMMAHSFKGSSGNMGATRLSELCRELEDAGRASVPVSDDEVQRMVAAIEEEFRLVRAFFDQELHTCLSGH
ncbi:Hpt domain-containing protein [Pseudomonas sp. NFR16]|nr:Hpt domain-containing protein [Pseudomonas sp. NFR16]